MSTSAPSIVGQDPHLSEAWFALLRNTALPPGTTAHTLDIGMAAAPASAQLHLMRRPDAPRELHGLSTFYTPRFGPSGPGPIDAEALCAHWRRIRRTAGAPHLIQLAPLAPDDRFFTLACSTLRQAGWLVDDYFCFGNWHADVSGQHFDDYLAARPSQLRNTLLRHRRKLARRSDFNVRIQVAANAALPAAIAEFTRVYNLSWKQPEPFPQFIPGLCALAANQGWLRLGLLELDSRTVAAQLWLVAAGTAYIVKLAHDKQYAALGVGTVLTGHLMQHVIDIDRVQHIDYLIGDDPYKRNWTPLRRERRGLIAFNPASARGLALAARHFAGRALKGFRRHISGAGTT
ncbi:GNAT family N-acetyltransferase [Thauera sp. AutoDN2]|uniref:GNAT family N-acetyltransferase n=1 Tax=Thauera sp. AutoDN2 TaxID=3416051 RepID=UPI003F4BAB7F